MGCPRRTRQKGTRRTRRVTKSPAPHKVTGLSAPHAVIESEPQGPLQPTSTAFEDTSRLALANGSFVVFVCEFKHLGSIIHFPTHLGRGHGAPIKSATLIFMALRDSALCNKSVDFEVKRMVYVVFVLSIVLYGSASWSLRADLLHRLRSFHNCACRSICRITMAHHPPPHKNRSPSPAPWSPLRRPLIPQPVSPEGKVHRAHVYEPTAAHT